MKKLPSVRFYASRRGFTLVEMALVIGIMTIVLSAIWLGTGAVSRRQAMEQGVNEAWEIANNARNAYSGHSSAAASANTHKLTCAGIFPTAILQGANTFPCASGSRRSPVSPWGTPITASFTNSGLLFDVDFSFAGTAAKIKEDCINFLSHFPVKGTGTGTSSDVERAEGGPVDAFFLNGAAASSVKNVEPAGMANLMVNGCTGVRLRFKM